MKKPILVFTLTAILALLMTGAALASHGEPVGGCPGNFELHHVEDHDHEGHEHQHVGNDTDKNGDGWICVKHSSADESIHVHRDNSANFPLEG
jgi:hypothetical protein